MTSTLKPHGPHMVKPVALLSLLTVFAAQISQQPSGVPSLPPTIDGIPTGGGLVGLVLFFLGSMVTTFINLYLQKRDREWRIADDDRKRTLDAEDRERHAREQAELTQRAATELKRTADQKAAETAETAKQVAEYMIKLQREQHQALAEKIDANTQVNEQALSAANAINQKIAHIGAAATDRAGRRTTDAALAQLRELETVIEEQHAGDEPQAKP